MARREEAHRFHLPIPSVFRPSTRAAKKQKKQEAKLRPEIRPATIAELADLAATADLVFNPAIPIRRFLAGAHGLLTQADSYLSTQPPDNEQAFVCLAKAARLLVDLLPNSHPGWKTELSAEARNKAKADAQVALDKISQLKPVLLECFDTWKTAHPKITDITKVPTSLSLPAALHELSAQESDSDDSEPEDEPAQAQAQLQPQQWHQQWQTQSQPQTVSRASAPSPSSSVSTLQYHRPERPTESFDVRTILGYQGAGAASMGVSSSSSSSSRNVSSNSILYPQPPAPHTTAASPTTSSVPYSAASSSAIVEPWAAPSSNTQTVGRFAYPLLRRTSTQRSYTTGPGPRRQQTAESTTSSMAMTPDQSGQGFAPRTALGESYYLTLPPPSSSGSPSLQQAFPWASPPPPLPPPLGTLATSVSSSASAPNSPLNPRSSGVAGPRPLGGPSQSGPPRPAKSLTQFPPIPGLAQPQSPALPDSISPTSAPPQPPIPEMGALAVSGPPPLPAIGPDGGGLRLERHATQLLTMGRNHHQQQYQRPNEQPQPQPPQQQMPPPQQLQQQQQQQQHVPGVPLPPRQRPQRSATEEEEAQLAWAIEESRKDMEEMERKAAAASANVPAPVSTIRSAPTSFRTEEVVFPATAFTEGGTPLRTVVLPTRVLSIFLALARENTENNIETCALLMGKLRASSNSFLITHLTVPAQSGASDRCETHNEEAIWAFQEEHDLVTVGWIHTHPSQSAFLSSLDLHTHCSFQAMTPEAIAIVCAPRHEPSFGLFRLTDPHGVQTIMHCRAPGLFHPHVSETGHDLPALYTDALHGHVKLDPEARLMVVDLR
ncbi:hypothetical protein OC835_001739 [Tilletia horrida]|nr:hypothetical protein OC835_001739 [Tilletia horrida]